MDVNAAEFKSFVDLVTEMVASRLRSAESADVRQLQLRDDAMASAERFSNLPEVLKSARRVLAEHDIEGFEARIDSIHQREGASPPDDIYEELRRLEWKIRQLQNGDSYELKFWWRHQINIADLIAIIVEILEILRKLYGRSLPRRDQRAAGD